MFIIRADGNADIGMGHIMRCLSIADAMAQMGEAPVFVTAFSECVPVIEQRGFGVELLEAVQGKYPEDMMAEIPQIADMLEKLPQMRAQFAREGEPNQKHVVLVDSYRVTKEYFEEIKKLAYIACLEDMGQAYPVHLLINYNIYGPRFASVYEEAADRMLLGPSYMPVRQEFVQDIDYTVRREVKDVMITTGGTDPFLAAKAFTDTFLAEESLAAKDIRYHIVSGPFNCRAEELKVSYQGNDKVIIYENVKSMKDIMRRCDVVLTASGSTIYEVSALGLPMICFFFAENQRLGAEEIERVSGVPNCGDFSAAPQMVVEKAVKALCRYAEDRNSRLEAYRKGKSLIDGQGAARIAAAIVGMKG